MACPTVYVEPDLESKSRFALAVPKHVKFLEHTRDVNDKMELV